MDEVKQTVEVFGMRVVNDLSGNEVFALFATALDAALKIKDSHIAYKKY